MDSDPCKWAVWIRKIGGAEIFILQAPSPETKEIWINAIRECHNKKRPWLLKGCVLLILCSVSLFFLDLKLLKELFDISVLSSIQVGTNIEVGVRRKKQSE